MANEQNASSDLAALVVPQVGRLADTGDPWEPYRIIGADGTEVEAVSVWFADLLAGGRSPATLRSYGMDLLRWLRFLWALGVPWHRVTRTEARDFSRWLQVAGKPARPHWRHRDETVSTAPRRSAYAASVDSAPSRGGNPSVTLGVLSP